MARNPASIARRQRELARQRKRRQKQARREERREQKNAASAEGATADDPTIDWGEAVREVALEDEVDEESAEEESVGG